MRLLSLFLTPLTVAIGLVACAGPSMPEPAVPLSPALGLCFDGGPQQRCRQPEQVQSWLAHPDLRIEGSGPTPSGLHGAKVLTLSLPSSEGAPLVFRAKWRPLSTEMPTNSPRKELAAYVVQQLFLEPGEYVVPPTSGHCFPLGMYHARVEQAGPSFESLNCVFGFLSYWIEDAMTLAEAVEEEHLQPQGSSMVDTQLFANNPVYRESTADVNLLSYLIRHGDAHPDQFIMLAPPAPARMYSVDNSVAFESIKNPMLLLREDWSQIQVPALPRQHLRRLANLERADFAQFLTLQRFESTLDGQLRLVERRGSSGYPNEAIKWVGRELIIGLTSSEAKLIQRRIRELLAREQSGDIKTFKAVL